MKIDQSHHHLTAFDPHSLLIAAQRLGMMSQERRGRSRREIPGALEIIRDCIEVERMTVPMIINRFAVYGHTVSGQWVHSRIREQGYGLRKELLINAAARRARGRTLHARRIRAANRQQEAA